MPRGRGPADAAPKHSVAEVELSLVVLDLAVANVKEFVVNQEADDFVVGDIDGRLYGLGVGVSALCIRQRAQLVEWVQVGAGQAVRPIHLT